MSEGPMQPGPASEESPPPVTAAAPVVPPPPTTPAPPGVPHLAARTSGMAATSLILGILGFLSCGLTGLVGLVFAIVALVGIHRNPGHLRGQGIAVAGLVLSVVSMASLVFYGFLAAVALPALTVAAEETMLDESTTRLRTVVIFTEHYWSTHDGAFPPVDDWVAALKVKSQWLAYPDDPYETRVFAMNSELDGMYIDELDDAANTVLYFEATPGEALAGGPELIAAVPQYWQGYLVVYANGDLGMVAPHEMLNLIWAP